MIRVLLADNNGPLRWGLCDLLGQTGRVEVIGEAIDGLEAVRLAKTLLPDVLVLNARLPFLDGLQVAEQLASLAPNTRILLVSRNNQQVNLLNSRPGNIQGQISKTALYNHLQDAIETIYAGQSYFAN